MILWLAKIGVLLFALWLIAAAVFMVINPARCLALLRKMGSTPTIHFGEHFLRGLVGLSFMGIAPISDYPKPFMIVGAFLTITSIAIGLAPRRWHHAYAMYWSEKISPTALRIMVPVPLLAGVYLLTVLVSSPNSL